MISTNGFKRKPLDNQMNSNKRFRCTDYDGNSKMIINNSKQEMSSEYRQLQYELQCQEALLVLMQKLKTNQKSVSQTNHLKQRTTTTPTTAAAAAAVPVNATKLNSVSSTTATKISNSNNNHNNNNNNNRITPTKPPHPNQYTVNRTSSNPQVQSTKNSVALPQATRQSNTNSTIPQTATRLSSTNTNSAVKPSTNSKNNGVNSDQHLINAKLALRKQLEQTLLQIPTPKPTTCDLTYIPGINGWAEFLTSIGLEQAYNTYSDFVNRRLNPEVSFHLPHICAQCGTDWSVTWHEVSCSNENEIEEKIFCDRCRKSSQKKILKQDHSNRLRQAFMKALQQEKELDAKFQSSGSSTTVKQPSSSSSSSSSSHNKHSSKNLSTKLNSSSSKHSSSNNHHSHHSSKSNSVKQQAQIPPQLPPDAFASTLAALPTNEQIEFFQKHILSNMFPLAFANQAAAAAALSPKALQQQQQALAASFPAMAASLMRQGNPAQYLLDMIPQAAKQQQQQQQQQQHHHRHSK